jgi:diaminopropionate ammonia-lyase
MNTINESGITHFKNPAAHVDNVYSDSMRDIVNLQRSRQTLHIISQWPGYGESPLHQLTGLAQHCDVGQVYYKDESDRFGLKSFKALGGSYAVARQLLAAIEHATGETVNIDDLFSGDHAEIVEQITVVTATDGNHGRSVAWGAQLFGCQCVIYIHADVSAGREQSIAEFGADVRRIAGNYDDSVRDASSAARDNGWIVVSDTSYDGYLDIPKDVAAGYTVMLQEIVTQLDGHIPSHVLVQGGCGGLASTVCGYFWELWGETRPRLVIVEPEQANCLQLSAQNERVSVVPGKLETLMAGLACGEVSLLAWDILASGANDFTTLPDRYVATAMKMLARGIDDDPPIEAGESAVAGVAVLMAIRNDSDMRKRLGLTTTSRVLVLGTEGATDPGLYEQLIR